MGTPQWVKLFLVPQTAEANTMPPYVTGLLSGDTPTHYVLNPMLDRQLNEETGEEHYIPAGMNFINRVYVWRCQILDTKPDEDFENQDQSFQEDTSGGLG